MCVWGFWWPLWKLHVVNPYRSEVNKQKEELKAGKRLLTSFEPLSPAMPEAHTVNFKAT